MSNHTITKTCFFLHLDTGAVQEAYASYVVNIVLNCITAPPAIVFNTVVLIAIWRTPSLHTPSHLFLGSLCFSDIGVGIITQPFYVAYKFAEMDGKFTRYCTMGVTALVSSYLLAGGSFLTLTAISIDRYLALHLRLRYRLVVTTSRIMRVLIALWLFSALLGVSQMLVDPRTFIRTISSLMVLCLVIITCAYTMAFRALKLHQARIGTNSQGPSPFSARDINKYRGSLTAMLYILGLILLSYVPYLCVSVTIAMKGLNGVTRAARNIASPILFANSSLNPVLYFWKIKEIRHACRNALRKALHQSEESAVNVRDSSAATRGLPVVE